MSGSIWTEEIRYLNEVSKKTARIFDTLMLYNGESRSWAIQQQDALTRLKQNMDAIKYAVPNFKHRLQDWMQNYEFPDVLDEISSADTVPEGWRQDFHKFLIFGYLCGPEKKAVVNGAFETFIRGGWNAVERTPEYQKALVEALFEREYEINGDKIVINPSHNYSPELIIEEDSVSVNYGKTLKVDQSILDEVLMGKSAPTQPVSPQIPVPKQPLIQQIPTQAIPVPQPPIEPTISSIPPVPVHQEHEIPSISEIPKLPPSISEQQIPSYQDIPQLPDNILENQIPLTSDIPQIPSEIPQIPAIPEQPEPQQPEPPSVLKELKSKLASSPLIPKEQPTVPQPTYHGPQVPSTPVQEKPKTVSEFKDEMLKFLKDTTKKLKKKEAKLPQPQVPSTPQIPPHPVYQEQKITQTPTYEDIPELPDNLLEQHKPAPVYPEREIPSIPNIPQLPDNTEPIYTPTPPKTQSYPQPPIPVTPEQPMTIEDKTRRIRELKKEIIGEPASTEVEEKSDIEEKLKKFDEMTKNGYTLFSAPKPPQVEPITLPLPKTIEEPTPIPPKSPINYSELQETGLEDLDSEVETPTSPESKGEKGYVKVQDLFKKVTRRGWTFSKKLNDIEDFDPEQKKIIEQEGLNGLKRLLPDPEYHNKIYQINVKTSGDGEKRIVITKRR